MFRCGVTLISLTMIDPSQRRSYSSSPVTHYGPRKNTWELWNSSVPLPWEHVELSGLLASHSFFRHWGSFIQSLSNCSFEIPAMRTTDSDPSIVWILLVNAQGDMTSYYIPSLFCCLAHHDDIMSLLVTFTNEQSSNAEDDLVSRSKEILLLHVKAFMRATTAYQ